MQTELNHLRNARGLTEDLRAARALIDTPKKWRKDGAGEFKSCCAIVATNRAVMNEIMLAKDWRRQRTLRLQPMRLFLYEALPKEWQTATGDDTAECIGDFNDAPTTTHADVMALFDRAISNSEASDAR